MLDIPFPQPLSILIVNLCSFSFSTEKVILSTPTVDMLSWCRSAGVTANNTRGDRLLLFIGIIDILQSYRLTKKLEHTLKAMVSEGVSQLLCSQCFCCDVVL